MTVVPAPAAETVPVVLPIVATELVLLLHTPPAIASVYVLTLPMHKEDAPVIAAGKGRTVTVLVTAQPGPIL